jgi:hypothetical protein
MLYKEWVKLIEEFKASGKSQVQWCREKNLRVKAFNYQYRKYRKENKAYAPEVNTANWLPVELKPMILPKVSIRVGKAVIEIEKDYDEGLLQKVIRSLEAIC